MQEALRASTARLWNRGDDKILTAFGTKYKSFQNGDIYCWLWGPKRKPEETALEVKILSYMESTLEKI